MPGAGDPDNRRISRWLAWRQAKSFSEDGRTPEQQIIFSAVRNLLQIRRQHAALRTGKLFHIFSDGDSYVFMRQTEDERLLVIFTNGSKPRALTSHSKHSLAGALRSTILYGNGGVEINGREVKITAPAQSISIFRCIEFGQRISSAVNYSSPRAM